MTFDQMIGPFAVWVVSPSPACHLIQTGDELVEFLLHDDGTHLRLSQAELRANLNNPFVWKKDSDGKPLGWSIQLGFTSVWVLRVSPTPSLVRTRCSWCGEFHDLGPENCKV